MQMFIFYENLLFDLGSYLSKPAFNCSKLSIGTLEQGVKYVQS